MCMFVCVCVVCLCVCACMCVCVSNMLKYKKILNNQIPVSMMCQCTASKGGVTSTALGVMYFIHKVTRTDMPHAMLLLETWYMNILIKICMH